MRTSSASPLRRRSLGTALLTAGVVATGALAPHTSHAQSVSKAGTTAAAFLSIGVGARAMGQGSAYVASADDVTSLYWNAAGLARMTRGEVTASHSAWLGDLQHDHLAAAMPLAGGVAAGVETAADLFASAVFPISARAPQPAATAAMTERVNNAIVFLRLRCFIITPFMFIN